jgi:Lon protease-like protein
VARRSGQRYRGPADLPQRIPVFPLRRAILLPRVILPLNIFEPRYLRMVEDVMSTSRVLGMVQPGGSDDEESPAGAVVPLRRVGCAGRITAYEELADGRLLITLTGIARFTMVEEVALKKPYRICTVSYDAFLSDFAIGEGEDAVDRRGLLTTLRTYVKAHDLDADWDAIGDSSNEELVNMLAVISPFGPEEKQALLEAANLKGRAEMLVALAEMELASRAGGSGSVLQ